MNEVEEHLSEALSTRYPYKKDLGENEFYFDKSRPLSLLPKELQFKVILPDYVFYQTSLVTPFDAFPIVDVIVAFNKADIEDSRILVSPAYRAECNNFMSLFLGKKTGVNKEEINPDCIAKFFERITYEGRVKLLAKSENQHIYNLFSGSRCLNSINIEVDKAGFLSQVSLSNCANLETH